MVANFSVEDQIIARQIERAVPGASTLLQSITNGRKGNSLMQHKNETLVLGWLDPRNNSIMHAGVGFYNATYGEYLLKIDEEPCEKQYYLKTCACEGERTNYRMELIIKHKKRQIFKTSTCRHGL